MKNRIKLGIFFACFLNADLKGEKTAISFDAASKGVCAGGSAAVTIVSPLIADMVKIGVVLGGGYDIVAAGFAKAGFAFSVAIPFGVLSGLYFSGYGLGWLKGKSLDFRGFGITVAGDVMEFVRVGVNCLKYWGRGWSVSIAVNPYYNVMDYVEISGQVYGGMSSVQVPEQEMSSLESLGLIQKSGDNKFSLDKKNVIALSPEYISTLKLLGNAEFEAELDSRKADLSKVHKFVGQMEAEQYKKFVNDFMGNRLQDVTEYVKIDGVKDEDVTAFFEVLRPHTAEEDVAEEDVSEEDASEEA